MFFEWGVVKEVELDFIENEEAQAEKYFERMKSLKAEKKIKHNTDNQEEQKVLWIGKDSSLQSFDSDSSDNNQMEEQKA